MFYNRQYEEAKELGIKACQCGGRASIHEIGNDRTKKRCVEIHCSKCRIKRRQCMLNSTSRLSFEDLKKGVIKDWNTRPFEDKLTQALDNANEMDD